MPGMYPAGEYDEAPAFKIARAGGANKKYDALQRAGLKPFQRLIQAQSKNLSAELMETIGKVNKSAFIGACLLDWKNVFDKNGNQVPFSKEAAATFMDQLPALYEDLFGYATSIATFQDEEIEADSGN
jgi:hypothetical protein